MVCRKLKVLDPLHAEMKQRLKVKSLALIVPDSLQIKLFINPSNFWDQINQIPPYWILILKVVPLIVLRFSLYFLQLAVPTLLYDC